MTEQELQDIMEVIRKAYNGTVHKIQEQVEKPSISVEDAFRVIALKEGAEMAMMNIVHMILWAYGLECEMTTSDGEKVRLGKART